MGYDYTLNADENKCDCCGRSDVTQLEDFYTSYNHSWAFYNYLDEKWGLRWIYDRPLKEIIPRLEDMLEALRELNTENEKTLTDWKENFETNKDMVKLNGLLVENNGWGMTVGNAYWFANRILKACKKYIVEHPTATFDGD